MVDGIFAIAMTLLVLGITPPKPTGSQAQAILPGMVFRSFSGDFYFYYRFFDSCDLLAEPSPPFPFRPLS